MTRPITILLIDSSPITSVRLVELLQNTKEVDHVFCAREVRKGCAIFSVCTVDALILVKHLENQELVKLSELCKVFGCKLILLSEYSHSGYRSWCNSIGVSYLLDKASDVDQVRIILKQMLNN